MNDCGCEKARKDLEEFIHNELDAAEAKVIKTHLLNCEGCEEEVHIGHMLTEKLQKACKEKASQELKDRVLQSLATLTD